MGQLLVWRAVEAPTEPTEQDHQANHREVRSERWFLL